MESQGILNKSMRKNYNEYGVGEYYNLVGSTYRNPHFSAIKQCIFAFMNVWWAHESTAIHGQHMTVLDLAAGSGEVTVCILEWWKHCSADQPDDPRNPKDWQEQSNRAFIPPSLNVKRAASPSSCFPRLGGGAPTLFIMATDPYTAEAYHSRTNMICHPLSFREIALGSMPPVSNSMVSKRADGTNQISNGTSSDIIELTICSFAMHLVESPSELFGLLWELSTKVRWLVIISPHKKPEIKENWGWILWDPIVWQSAQGNGHHEIVKDRVRCRIFRSSNL